jgi:hypothetical protein
MGLISKIITELQLSRKAFKQMQKHALLNARLLSKLNQDCTKDIEKNIRQAEFSVYSQWGDDGIIDFLVNYLDIPEKKFIEFGVGDYTESNTRYLLEMYNWSGLVIDGSSDYIKKIKAQELYWKYSLTAVNSFVTTENINTIFKQNNFSGDIGILHIDIDGNDYWIWNCITEVNPVIVIMEFNSFYGKSAPYTVPYNPTFSRFDIIEKSHIFWGASISSLCDLAESKGYAFIGCNSNANNSYFVRKDKLKGIEPKSIDEGYVKALFRECRDAKGELKFTPTSLDELSGMEIYNTRTQQLEKI